MPKTTLIIKTYLSLGYKVYIKNKSNTKKLINDIYNECNLKSNCLSEETKKRIEFYTAQCVITSSWFCTLRGKKLKESERKSILFLGAITPIVDDLTDDSKITSDEILTILEDKTYSKIPQHRIAQYLYRELIKYNDSDFFKSIFKEALIAQDASLQQLNSKKLANVQLKEIAYRKGGFFVFLYRCILKHPIQKGEKERLFRLGYMLQQTNDAFDIYKDFKNGQQTLFTNSKNIKNNYDDFNTNVNQLITEFKALNYEKKNIQKCLIEIATVTSRATVCLNQLLKLQGKEDTFNVQNFSRKELICDMEKFENIRSSFLYSLEFSKKIDN